VEILFFCGNPLWTAVLQQYFQRIQEGK